MVKHTQTICRQIADELFECFWPFCDTGAQKVKYVTCCVPKGSILKPPLFLVYVNSLTNTSRLLDPIMFVDDTIGILYKARPYLDKRALQCFYYSCIHSYLNYGNTAWSSTNRTYLKKLQSQQKARY